MLVTASAAVGGSIGAMGIEPGSGTQLCRITLLALMAKRGADELACKPDSAHADRGPGVMTLAPHLTGGFSVHNGTRRSSRLRPLADSLRTAKDQEDHPMWTSRASATAAAEANYRETGSIDLLRPAAKVDASSLGEETGEERVPGGRRRRVGDW